MASVHIMGICGTFMGGLAALAKACGFDVTGSDADVYPPMSEQLHALGIALMQGYSAGNLTPAPDRVIIGNALSRGNPEVEAALNKSLNYTSGAQWLAENVLRGRQVIAVAGTHGKTTTASMLAWILEHAGLAPGFLIGGVPRNFECSARLGCAPFFVVEADEYDTAFFDKRSKFIHYRPHTLVLNNLEFDHADIFADLADIEIQFHHLIRTVPGNGTIIVNGADETLARVLARGCWTPCRRFAIEEQADWQARTPAADGSAFDVCFQGEPVGRVSWPLIGRHNVQNALAALAAAHCCGVAAAEAVAALGEFAGVKRRLEPIATVAGVTLYDDFAHHPTAIATTLDGLRRRVGKARILAVLEPRSFTMRAGTHRHRLASSLRAADAVFLYRPPKLGWDLAAAVATLTPCPVVADDVETLSGLILDAVRPGDHILIMSNGGFDGLYARLADGLNGVLEKTT
jgi:UDP-N-acetylmuramate: L-alanyl-gamma-D-glutamyl-meso-diaminopimelate ligase